jgi:hypothetical protein
MGLLGSLGLDFSGGSGGPAVSGGGPLYNDASIVFSGASEGGIGATPSSSATSGSSSWLWLVAIAGIGAAWYFLRK